MGKKRRKTGGLQHSPKQSSTPSASGGFRSGLPPSRGRRIIGRVALIMLLPFLLVLTEIALRMGGFGYPTSFFIPEAGGTNLVTNRRFGWRFMPRQTATQPHPTRLPAKKEAGVVRIFVLGESAAQGTPAPAFGFARILEVMLQRQFPERRFEVVNAAMRGINSHVVLPIARECASLSPDLFLIYMGNNEAVGLWSPSPGKLTLTRHPRLIRASQWAKSTKLAQLTGAAGRALSKSPAKKPVQDMDFFRRSRLTRVAPGREAVYGNFGSNLDGICRAARSSGAKVILSTVAVNLKDFPPLGSLHRAGLAREELARWEECWLKATNAEARAMPAEALLHFRDAAKIDDEFAELHYRMARCLLSQGQLEPARTHFKLACDWDALQFRTDSRQNDIIRECARSAKDPGLVLVDAEQAFAAASEDGLPGGQFFHEHVHLTFDGDYLLAQSFYPAVVDALQLLRAGHASAGEAPPSRPDKEELTKTASMRGEGSSETRALPAPLDRRGAADELAFTEWDSMSVGMAVARMTAHPPFLDQAEHAVRQAQYEQAVQSLRQALQEPGRIGRVREIYQAAARRHPDDWQIRFNHGSLLSDLRDDEGAVREYQAAAGLMPIFLPLRVNLAQALWSTGRRLESKATLEDALREDPDFAPARDALAQVSGARRK